MRIFFLFFSVSFLTILLCGPPFKTRFDNRLGIMSVSSMQNDIKIECILKFEKITSSIASSDWVQKLKEELIFWKVSFQNQMFFLFSSSSFCPFYHVGRPAKHDLFTLWKLNSGQLFKIILKLTARSHLKNIHQQ